MSFITGLWVVLGISFVLWMLSTCLYWKSPRFLASGIGVLISVGSVLCFIISVFLLVAVGLIKLASFIIGVFF